MGNWRFNFLAINLDNSPARFGRGTAEFCRHLPCPVLLGDGSKMSAVNFKLAAVTFPEKFRRAFLAKKWNACLRLARWLSEQWFSSGILHASVGRRGGPLPSFKCDLVTDMVRGYRTSRVVGGLYAKLKGEPEDVAWAVYDHYKPSGLEDSIPRNIVDDCRVGR